MVRPGGWAPTWKLTFVSAFLNKALANYCACCGYQIQKNLLDLCESPMQLSFLGSGFPLFYNFIIYCIFILFTQLMVKGGFDIVTNLLGDFCKYKNGSNLD